MKIEAENLELFESGIQDRTTSRERTLRRSMSSKSMEVVLTERDFNILRFILEMKFSSSAEVFEKFFSVTRTSEEARSDAWAKKRLLQLERGGFLRSAHSFSEATKYFIVTYRGYYALQAVFSDEQLPKPIPAFDLRTFHHDKLVLQARVHLEKSELVTNWISDRMLKAGADRSFGFSSKNVPDAVFETASGEKVAFEVEIAQKARARYRDKIKSYVNLIRSAKSEFKINAVRFYCLREQPYEIIKAETKIFGGLFSTERTNLETFLAGAR